MTYTTISTTGYHPDIFTANQMQDWDGYQNRLSRYTVLDGYYHNMAYHAIKSYAESLKVHEQLYKHVRGVYNPTKRLVDAYVSKTYGGMLDTKDGKGGAIPLDTENDALKELIAQRLWIDSQWGQKKSLYTRYGAKLGDSYIKVIDNIQKGRVWMEVVDPGKVKELEKDPDGTITKIVFEYYMRIHNQLVRYCETITPDYFEAYVLTPQESTSGSTNYQRQAIYANGRNEPVMQWDNDYGYVPVVHVLHTDEGQTFGAPAIHGVYHKINEVNDIASIQNDASRNQAVLPLVAINGKIGTKDFGTDQSSNSTNTVDNPKKDTMKVIELWGDNADLKTLPPTLNLADSIQNIIEVLKEIERDSPELSLHRLRDAGNLTAPGVRSAYDDAIAKFQEARGNYDTGLVKAQKMAIMIGGMRGYAGYEAFRGVTLDDERLQHQIAQRPVINDSLGLSEMLTITASGVQSNMPKSYYVKAGWGDDDAKEYAALGQSTRDSFMMTSPFETATTTPMVDDPNATPQDAFNTRENTGLNEADLLNADQLIREVV